MGDEQLPIGVFATVRNLWFMRGIGDENYPCTSHNSPGEVLVDLLFPTKTLYTVMSVLLFSTLFPLHFLQYSQGESVRKSGASKINDHFLCSRGLNFCFRGDTLRRNLNPVTPRGLRINESLYL